MALLEPLTLAESARNLLQDFWGWIFRFWSHRDRLSDLRKKRTVNVRPMPLNVPSDEENKFSNPHRRMTVPLAGKNLTINTAERAAGDLYVDEEELSDEEIAHARTQLRKLAQRLVSTLSRNRRHSSTKMQIDFRRSMRKSIQTGGVIVDLKYRTRVIKKPQLVMILDTSGSMQIWIKLLIQLIQAIGLELSKKEIFIFAHDLECVTKDLGKTWQETVEALKLRKNWGGTTSILTALKTLQKDYHDKFSPHTIVLMLSDLYTSEPEDSAKEVKKMCRKTKSFYIFRAAERDLEPESIRTYYETYVRPFIGSATAIFEIDDIDSMASAVRNVCIRH